MAIPSCFTSYIFTFHRLVTRKDILKDAGFDVVGTGHAVGRRRTFIESPRLTAFTRIGARLEDGIFAPEIKDRTFHAWKVDRCGNRAHLLWRVHEETESNPRTMKKFAAAMSGRVGGGCKRA